MVGLWIALVYYGSSTLCHKLSFVSPVGKLIFALAMLVRCIEPIIPFRCENKLMKVLPILLAAASVFSMSVLPVVGHAFEGSAEHSGKIASIEQLLGGLRDRLEQDPSDMKGWVLLAKSYNHLGMKGDAEAAAEKAKALGYKGDIFAAQTAAKPKASGVMPKDRHHQAVTDPNAGSYVSSFFDNIDDAPVEQKAEAGKGQ